MVPTCLVMYNSRSACSGSVSSGGLILWPQSHTLRRDELMFGDSWISGCEDKKKAGGVKGQRSTTTSGGGAVRPLVRQEPTSASDSTISRTRWTLMSAPRVTSLSSSEAWTGGQRSKVKALTELELVYYHSSNFFFPTSLDND